MSFSKDFVWGVAAASYQVEGAANEDGKGLSVWDMFCRKENAIWNHCNGDVACDHYHRYKEDVAIMKSIGVNAYRLSVAWPRVIPAGIGQVNAKGLEFYDRLVDELLLSGIEPYVTLFHWDYPYELYCRGGWLNPQSPEWFAEYTSVVVRRLSDRVKNWMPMNEPQCFIGLGHHEGRHAPGDQLGFPEILRSIHHTLLAHGKSVQAIRANSKGVSRVGTAMVGKVCIPVNGEAANLEAARREMFAVNEKNAWNNTWWMDPLWFGKYPEDGLRLFGKDVPAHDPQDLRTMCQPLDFLGVNNYFGMMIRQDEKGKPQRVPFDSNHPLTAFRWYVTPDTLYWCSKFMYERYKLPVMITENGMSNIDWVSLDGKVYDPQRIDFLHRHLKGLKKAADEGVDVRGYFQWSIMDNFEWQEGFKERFGLVYVDYQTQKRILKESAHWYKSVIASNGENL